MKPMSPTISSVMLPTYRTARQLLRTLAGTPRVTVTRMIDSIYRSSGSPEAQEKWNNPAQWIDLVLEGEENRLAKRIWIESETSINPRYVKGPHLFLNKQQLITTDEVGNYEITSRGNAFLIEDSRTVFEIDRSEGVLEILRILSINLQTREELVRSWRDFALTSSNYKAESSIRVTLSDRIKNLIDRNLVSKDRSRIAITARGRAHLGAVRAK
jgi:restriction system protein